MQSVPELHRDEPPKLNVPIDSNVAVACDEVDVPYASRNADAFMYAMHVHGDVAVPDGPTPPLCLLMTLYRLQACML